MECKGCSKDLTDLEYKMVAEWPFCLQCFDRLMHRKQEEGFVGDGAPEADDSAFAESPAVEPTRAQQELTAQVCSLCGKPLAAGEARRLAIWTMCPGCYESLASGPAPTSGESSESSASETEEEAVQFHVRTEFMKGVNCR